MLTHVGGAVGGHALGHWAACCPRGAWFAPAGPRMGRQLAQRHQLSDGGVAQDGGDAKPIVYARAACAELATYSLEAPMNTSLLTSCVREAVLHLDDAPCLHVASTTYAPEFITHAVPESVATVPQLWKGIGEAIANEDAELLVLVHRVPDDSSPTCLKLHMDAERAQGTVQDSVQIWPDSSGAHRSLLANGLVTGTVGDCCDEHDHHHHGEGMEHRAAHQDPFDSDISFWGLVVQSKTQRSVEGCYLLKTVRNIDETGCSCTHFSMNRICQDVPLCEQFQASWLV